MHKNITNSFNKPRSLSANSRLSTRSNSTTNSITNPSPKRFDPTAWAKNKQKKVQDAMKIKNTFGNSRSPSRSISPALSNRSNHNISKNQSINNSKRDRSQSRSKKKNSFGATITNPNRSKSRSKINVNSSIDSTSSSIDLTNKNTMQKPPLLSNKAKYQQDESEKDVGDSKNISESSIRNPIKKNTIDDSDSDESTFNPTKEIETIDARLSALQTFLKAAKTTPKYAQ